MQEAEMSDPEIARRCSACGVSVRQRAMFCPQCGNPIPEASADTTFDTARTEALRPDLAPTQPLSAVVTPPPQNPSEPEGVRARVDKFRKVSSIMIDQAAYDPSLRFLLVAAALFLLFLVLLILSKVIG
ncbi:MAG TPA: zinc ribbon domain-containing protein [Pyrinomonadaceae bacterium]|nr:zinc ribbon domain-containing protein [Pyrinomonadaceae bacterium]